MQFLKKNQYLTLYTVFFIIVLFRHIPMTYISDDAVNIELIGTTSIADFIVGRFYGNGRFITDGLAFILYHIPLTVWKILDTFAYIILAKLISYEFSKNNFEDQLFSCLLVLLYPAQYLTSAGYIATTTNYIYTLISILITIYPVARFARHREKSSFLVYLGITPFIIYLSNHEQYAITLIIGLIAYIAYCMYVALKEKSDYYKESVVAAIYPLVASAISSILMFFVPGRLNRMTSMTERERWLPQYKNWTFMTKAYKGYTSTVANIFYQRQNHIIIFCLALAIVAVLSFEHLSKIIVAVSVAPITLLVLVSCIGYGPFVEEYYYACGLMEIAPISEGFAPFVSLTVSYVIILTIINSVVLLTDNNGEKKLILLLITLGAISREMMGFSKTIYASSMRTFTILSYCMAICSLIIMDSVEDKNLKYLCFTPVLIALLL